MRRILLAALLLLGLTAGAQAQAAYNSSNSVYSAGTNTITIPLTVPAGAAVAVGCVVRDTGTVTCGTPLWNGSATGFTTFQTKLTNGGVATTVYCLANASGATANLTLAVSDNTIPSMGLALVFTGADTATPCTGVQSTNTTGLSATATPAVTTCTASGLGFDVIGHRDDSTAITSTQTQREFKPASTQGSVQGKVSTMAGSTSMSLGYTGLGSQSFNHIAGCIAAAAGGGASTRAKDCPLLGVCE